MRFEKHTNGVMRVFTDQLNSHIEKTAKALNIPIIWWPSANGGKNGDKLRYVEKNFANKLKKKNKLGAPSKADVIQRDNPARSKANHQTGTECCV